MVFTVSAGAPVQFSGIAASSDAAKSFVSRLVLQTVTEVLEQQGRSAGLPDVIISNILNQLTVQINYDPFECKTLSALKPGETMVKGVAMDKLPNCIIVGNTVTALCTVVSANGAQMCDLSMADNKLANIPPSICQSQELLRIPVIKISSSEAIYEAAITFPQPYKKFSGVMVILFNLTPALRFKVRVIFICVCWYAVSSASSITNKVVLQSYPYPITLALSNLMWVPVFSIPFLRMWEYKIVKLTSMQYSKYLTPISAVYGRYLYPTYIPEFLSGENSNYNVISAIGPQGAGKSTILSMIGGNNSQDMYRQYIFRPASREALESSRHQTTKIHPYITKFKEIFLDCQASNCASVLDEAIRYSRSTLTDGRYAINN
ncbi:hypothetical protein KIN20_001296 [Parelaphostrongylus tenuis]|uniref:Sugar phosphate transporter domain-containing protein n=1 Tax=Parelaphostrongylus tenuis TaxID=148309 RepID=A0AAD5MLZ7_PARTN|nr:hypothetical protein KIN20_001296 [Parelaphostrongylus tenuis]